MSCPVLNSGELKLKHLIGSSRVSGTRFGELEGSPSIAKGKLITFFKSHLENTEKPLFSAIQQRGSPKVPRSRGETCDKLWFDSAIFRDLRFLKKNMLLLIGNLKF